MNKCILFYSNFCPFCKEVLGFILKKSLRSLFVLVNVDEPRHVLPKFVDRVPMMVSSEGGNVLVDHHILSYLELLSNDMGAQQDVNMLTQDGVQGRYSSAYSFLESDPVVDDQASLSYAQVGTENMRIYTPAENETSSKKQGMDSGITMERLAQEREADVRKILGMATG